MRIGFYMKLAANGMKKNGKFYIPYLLTCICTIAMCYIVSALSVSPTLAAMRGGEMLISLLKLGVWVIIIFSVLLLSYTNSFLRKKRTREFGLYNILGMDKRNIGLILFFETMIMAFLSLFFGLLAGILLLKLAELLLVNMLHADVTYTLIVSWSSIRYTVILFLLIFLLNLLRNLFRITVSRPVELLHSESFGEKPPRANFLIGLLGVLILGGAYYLAVSIEDPISATVWFFVAVCMVIIGTYLLFISGSVVFLKLLQKNKRYYYKPNHFISVSSMAFRMKRNGAGLASICILATMVLVMIASSSCLFFGEEDSLKERHSRDFSITVQERLSYDTVAPEITASIAKKAEDVMLLHNAQASDLLTYSYLNISCVLDGSALPSDFEESYLRTQNNFSGICQLYFFSLDDYNRMMDTDYTLNTYEMFLYKKGGRNYAYQELTLPGQTTYHLKAALKSFFDVEDTNSYIGSTYFIVVPDLEAVRSLLPEDYSTFLWYYGFRTPLSAEEQNTMIHDMEVDLSGIFTENSLDAMLLVESVENDRTDFIAAYGGLFFLGILLSVAFILAAVLIIYFKQISEGYEDKSRFAIMQKVGLTDREIRRSINSQLLTVFFLPLLFAGLHLCFAFPLIKKILLLFGFLNNRLFILTTLISFAAFAVFYTVIYRMTSNAYYDIVRGPRENR